MTPCKRARRWPSAGVGGKRAGKRRASRSSAGKKVRVTEGRRLPVRARFHAAFTRVRSAGGCTFFVAPPPSLPTASARPHTPSRVGRVPRRCSTTTRDRAHLITSDGHAAVVGPARTAFSCVVRRVAPETPPAGHATSTPARVHGTRPPWTMRPRQLLHPAGALYLMLTVVSTIVAAATAVTVSAPCPFGGESSSKHNTKNVRLATHRRMRRLLRIRTRF